LSSSLQNSEGGGNGDSGDSPPLVSQAAALIASLVTLTRGIQGCPKIISFDKSNWHPTFKKSLQSSFLPLYTRAFSQHPLPKNALPSLSVINPRILFPFSLSLQFFHPSLINANYSCRRIFGTSLLTLFGLSLVLLRGGKADNERSNPVLLPLVPEFTNIWCSHLQLLHFQNFLLEVVAIGRKNAG
jgi:hypothetical protein